MWNFVSRTLSRTRSEGHEPAGNKKLRILCFWLLLFMPVIAFFEIASYTIIKRTVPSRILRRVNGDNSNSPIMHAGQSMERRVKGSSQKHGVDAMTLFHSVLGWDYPPDLVYKNFAGVTFSHGPGGERRCVTNYDTTLISTYGDSFTYCAEVGDGDTWQTGLGEKLRTNVLNFGVCGYGTDQALLKFELNKGPYTKLVILGVWPENVNRVVNVYRPFYAYSDTIMTTKPIFQKQGDTIRLISNPINSVAELSKLDQESFLEELGKVDYWYRLDKRLPKFSFPYTFSFYDWRNVLFSQLVAGINDLRKKRSRRPWNLYDEDNPLSIMCFIADLFVETARSRGSEPLIVIMPHKEDIRDLIDKEIPWFFRFTQYLSHKGYPFFDAVQCVADMHPSKQELDKLYGSHASAEGNRMLAEILSKRLTADYSCLFKNP